MLSSVSKLADKAFVIGFLLPALLAVFTARNVFHCPPWLIDLCTIKPESPFANLTYVALVVWVLAVLLLSLNYFEYRFFEGYIPPVSWLLLLQSWHKAKFNKLIARYEQLMLENRKIEAGVLRFKLFSIYPSGEGEIRPTRFGNAVRAFEVYSRDVYGADIISVWPRLGAVIPKEFQDLVNSARAQVDFFVNISVLSAALVLAVILKFALELSQLHFRELPADFDVLAVTVVIGAAVCCASYLWSVGRIVAWGDLVKSAFDCYLPALAKQLGYALPPVESQQREFWTDFSRLALYRDQLIDERWARIVDVTDPETKPQSAPEKAREDAAERTERKELGEKVTEVPKVQPPENPTSN